MSSFKQACQRKLARSPAYSLTKEWRCLMRGQIRTWIMAAIILEPATKVRIVTWVMQHWATIRVTLQFMNKSKACAMTPANTTVQTSFRAGWMSILAWEGLKSIVIAPSAHHPVINAAPKAVHHIATTFQLPPSALAGYPFKKSGMSK